MKIPKDEAKRLDLYMEVRESCLASRSRRMERYTTFRRYFLYGTPDGQVQSPWNKVYPALDLLTSFLYAADSTKFSIRLGSGAPKSDYQRTGAFAKRINEKWGSSNADNIFAQSLMWACVYDSTFLKLIRRGGSVHPFMVDPGSFGVYREDVPMLDRQEAFTHVYYMTLSDLERRLELHPKREDILSRVHGAQQKKDIASETPPLVDRVLMSSVTPNLLGEANVALDTVPDYVAELPQDLVEMSEEWIWDDANDDYQVVTMASDSVVVYDRPNFFLPRSREWEGEHCFIQVCPNPLPDYFWGLSEVARLAPLQDLLNDRMDDIRRLLQKQVDPPSGVTGQGINEEKLDALNSAGANVALGSDPSIKIERFAPQIPADVYKDVEKIEDMFMEAMGLSNVLLGKGESGVRSAGHAGKLANLGSSRPKKRALVIEESLEKAATLYGRCIFVDDDREMYAEDGKTKFIAAQMDPDFFVEVDGHSNSPVFMDNQRESAALLFKARAIDRKRLIEFLSPPKQEELIRDLEEKIIPGEKAAAQQRNAAIAAGDAKKGAGKLEAVK